MSAVTIYFRSHQQILCKSHVLPFQFFFNINMYMSVKIQKSYKIKLRADGVCNTLRLCNKLSKLYFLLIFKVNLSEQTRPVGSFELFGIIIIRAQIYSGHDSKRFLQSAQREKALVTRNNKSIVVFAFIIITSTLVIRANVRKIRKNRPVRIKKTYEGLADLTMSHNSANSNFIYCVQLFLRELSEGIAKSMLCEPTDTSYHYVYYISDLKHVPSVCNSYTSLQFHFNRIILYIIKYNIQILYPREPQRRNKN